MVLGTCCECFISKMGSKSCDGLFGILLTSYNKDYPSRVLSLQLMVGVFFVARLNTSFDVSAVEKCKWFVKEANGKIEEWH